MKGIKHIYFDLDHTLWDFEKNSQEVLEDMFEHFTCIQNYYPSKEKWVEHYRVENNRLWDLYSEQKVNRKDLRLNRFKNILEKGLDANTIASLSSFYLEHTPKKPYLMEGAVEILTYLSQLNLPLHIITNGFKETQEIKLKYSGIGDFTDELITSSDSGALKPHLKMFNFAADKIKAKPHEILLIGDSWKADALGAVNANWNAIWFNPTKKDNLEPLKINDIQCLKDLYTIFS